MMNTRVEMNEAMMAQVNGGNIFEDIINFDPIDVIFPEAPEKKAEREETRNHLVEKIIDFFL